MEKLFSGPYFKRKAGSLESLVWATLQVCETTKSLVRETQNNRASSQANLFCPWGYLTGTDLIFCNVSATVKGIHYGPRVISLNDIMALLRGLHNFYFEILRPVAGYHFRRLWEDNRVRMKRKGEIGAKLRSSVMGSWRESKGVPAFTGSNFDIEPVIVWSVSLLDMRLQPG